MNALPSELPCFGGNKSYQTIKLCVYLGDIDTGSIYIMVCSKSFRVFSVNIPYVHIPNLFSFSLFIHKLVKLEAI